MQPCANKCLILNWILGIREQYSYQTACKEMNEIDKIATDGETSDGS